MVIDEAEEYILSLRHIGDVKDAVWEAYCELGSTCSRRCGEGLSILILTAPCYGFGDIIFAVKLGGYLRDWYGCRVTFVTTHGAGFQRMGVPARDIVQLNSKSKNVECRRFGLLTPERTIPAADLMFIAPVPTNYDASLTDVKRLVKGSNQFNTFFFSEYNHDSPTDFPTGIGPGTYGIFLSNVTVKLGKPAGLTSPYAVAYITDTSPGHERCLYSFMEMVAAKYNGHTRFDIVVPSWVCEEIGHFARTIVKRVKPYFPNVDFVGKDKKREVLVRANSGANITKLLTIRCDVFPLPIPEMLRLIKASVPDILLTGDQSVSDCLSCCPSKTIWYQITPWKGSFGKGLAKELPQKYLASKTTSCGTLKALKYRSSFKRFLDKWDFRKLAKPKLDAIILAAKARRSSDQVREFERMLMKTKKLAPLKRMINNSGISGR